METIATRQSTITVSERSFLLREFAVSVLVAVVLWFVVSPIAGWLDSLNLDTIIQVIVFGLLLIAIAFASGSASDLMRTKRFKAALKKELNRLGYKNIEFNSKGYFTAANYHGAFVRGALACIDTEGPRSPEKKYAIVEF